MMSGSFKLEIELGNDAMQTEEDVASELRRVADLCEDGFTSGPLIDVNGNSVGHWEFVSDYPSNREETR